jgi:hypothetical protein
MKIYITVNKKIVFFAYFSSLSIRYFCSKPDWSQIIMEGLEETTCVKTYMLADLYRVDSPFYVNAQVFSKQWELSPNKLRELSWDPKELDFPHVSKIRLIIEEYPTKFFYLSTLLRLRDIKNQKLTTTLTWNLLEYYDTIAIQEVYNSFELITQHYRASFLSLSNDSYEGLISFLSMKEYFASSSLYTVYLKAQLKRQLFETKNQTISKYHFTPAFFLTKVNVSSMLLQFKKVSKDGEFTIDTSSLLPLSYSDLPLELASYLANSTHRAITWELDLTDIVFQLLKLNNMLDPTVHFNSFQAHPLFTQFIKHKKQYLKQWSEDYLLPEEFFIFCLNAFFMGKSEKTFKPLILLLKYEQQNSAIRSPDFGTILTTLKSSLMPLIHSFYYRQCDLTKLLNYKINNRPQVESTVQIDDFIFTLVLKDIWCLINEVDDKILCDIGLYQYKDIPERFNFAFILSIIVKQIESVIFNTLVSTFPKLTLDQKNYLYDIVLTGNNPVQFFIPKHHLNNVDLKKLLKLIANNIKESTGYEIHLKETDLHHKSTTIRDIIHKTKTTNVEVPLTLNTKGEPTWFLKEFTLNVYPYPSIITNNRFLEIDNGKDRLSFVELDILIKTLFPSFSYSEVNSLRKTIEKILTLRGFKVKQFRLDLKELNNFKTIFGALFNTTYTIASKDNRVSGIMGLRLKSTILNEFKKKIL